MENIEDLLNKYANGDMLDETVENLAKALVSTGPIGAGVGRKYAELEIKEKSDPNKAIPNDWREMFVDYYPKNKSPLPDVDFSFLKKAIQRKFPERTKEEYNQFINDIKNYKSQYKPGERQKHGFDFEERVIKNLNLKKAKKYGSFVDAYDATGKPVHIKTSKLGTAVSFGSLDEKKYDGDFSIIVGFWEKEKNNIVKIYKVDVNKDLWLNFNIFKNSAAKEHLMSIFKKFKTFTKDDEIAEKNWKRFLKVYKKFEEKNEVRTLKTHFKRDHKGQLRIQGVISYPEFIEFAMSNGATDITREI